MYPRSMFRAKIRKISHFSDENYHFYSREILQYIARTCLRTDCSFRTSARKWARKFAYSYLLTFLWYFILSFNINISVVHMSALTLR